MITKSLGSIAEKIDQKIIDFFFKYEKENYYFLPFFRISIGLFCLIHFLSVIPDFRMLYLGGLTPMAVSGLLKVSFMPTILNFMNLFQNNIGLSESTAINLFISVYIISCLLLIFGFLTRIAAFALIILQIMINQGAPLFIYGVDAFKSISIFYCFIFPVGRSYSLDNKLFKLSPANPTPYRRLLQIHLTIVYFESGFDKIIGPNWWNGESIWKSVHLPLFGNDLSANFNFMAKYPIIPLAIGLGTIIVELFYPLFMWNKKTRKLWLSLVIMMHISILISLNLFFFATLMILLNISCFFVMEKDMHKIEPQNL